MKIKYQELREKKRAPLAENVPLDTPWLVMLDPANACNLRCSFCPTGHRDLVKMRPNGVMDFDLYRRIIDGFAEMPHRIKKMVFCKDGEPLLNKRIVDMLRLAKEAEIADVIWLKTNGVPLNAELNSQLADLDIDLIGISIKAVSSEGYKRITGVQVDYEALLDKVADLHSKCVNTNVYVNTVNIHSPEDTAKFFADFEPICTTVALEDVHNWSMSEVRDFKGAGRVVDNQLVPRIACPFPLYSFAVNWNGEVSACQEDWAMKNIIGDLRTESVREIWRGEKRRDFLRTHLEGRRYVLPACANCSYIEFCPVNIDAVCVDLLERI